MNMMEKRSTGRHKDAKLRTSERERPSLTGNQQMVYDALLDLGRSARAYELIDVLRPKGVRAAPTVYRALHELEDKGLVKHLVASRSFVAFAEPMALDGHEIMLVCEGTGRAEIVKDSAVVAALEASAREAGFEIRAFHLELCGAKTGSNASAGPKD